MFCKKTVLEDEYPSLDHPVCSAAGERLMINGIPMAGTGVGEITGLNKKPEKALELGSLSS